MAAEDYIDDSYDEGYLDMYADHCIKKFNKKETKMKNNKINKYYVGATHIAEAIGRGANGEWTSETEKDAINHAKTLMENEDRDIAIIVKITHIIRRGKMPIEIKKLEK